MPQFDFSQALPQVLWLALIFGILYLIVRGLLPRVDKVVENRKSRIDADLAEAESARAAAEVASSGGTTAMADARGQSLQVTGRARDEAAAATAKRLAAVDADLERKADEAAASLAAARASALAELDAVATDATVDLVGRVAGLTITNDEAASAVRKVAA